MGLPRFSGHLSRCGRGIHEAEVTSGRTRRVWPPNGREGALWNDGLVSEVRAPLLRRKTVTRERINPPALFRSLDHGFSQGVVASGRRTLYVSGQTAWDAERRLIGGADLERQARQAFSNLKVVVEAAGATLASVVALRIYIVNYRPDNAAAVASVFRSYFSESPAVSWVGVASLADPAFLIEVEATAVLD